MTYRWLTDMDEALRAAGVDFVEVGYSSADPTGADSWRTRGRPYTTGDFDPSGVTCHHTASPAGTDAATDLRCILAGNGSAPGPISQTMIGRDAVLYLVAAGRANHAGSGIRPGIDSWCTDQNAHNLGIEVSNNGVGERWSDAVTDLYAATVAALCEWYGWATPAVYLHATTGPPYGGCNSKIDPAGPWQRQPDLVGSTTWDLPTWHAYVDEHRAGQPTPPPVADNGEEAAKMAATYVVTYGDIPDLPDGSVWEIIHGTRRNVGADEWYEILKGVMCNRDGSMPAHDPWQPVAYAANGWNLGLLPLYRPA